MRLFLRAFAAASVAVSCAAAAQPPGDPAAAPADRPILGAGSWVLQQRLPGMPGRVCTVRIAGPEANTTILLNADRRPVIILARPHWSGLRGDAELSISIDGAPPIGLSAAMAHNLVLVPISEEPLLQRLRGAKTLDWSLPFGRFHTDVSGLGAALDALLACRPDPAG